MKSRDKIMNRISIGYIRNSRITQENSISTQKSLIKEYCKNNPEWAKNEDDIGRDTCKKYIPKIFTKINCKN